VTTSIEENKPIQNFMSFLNGGSPTEVQETKDLLKDKNIS
jgi:hypothetical protein